MIEIKDSDVNGKGAFATEQIKKDAVLSCDVIYSADAKDAFLLNEKTATIVGFFQFVNSSQYPNIEMKEFDEKNMKVNLRVLKNIESGEEIFLNYQV